MAQLTELYERSQSGYTAADSTISLASKSTIRMFSAHFSRGSLSHVSNSFSFLAEVASNLGYEDLAEVTIEDMALEVSSL